MVIIKNAEKTIAKCLSSIVQQTYPLYEIIVVDGRSTDKTRGIVSQFPVKLVMAPVRDTYGASRNLGVNTATGDVIAFLDADDYAERNWLENIVEAFSNNNVGVVNPERVYTYPHNWFTDLHWSKKRKRPLLGDRSFISKDSWMDFMTSGSAIRKELIERAGYFDEDMFFGTEDKDLVLRIIPLGYRISFEPNSIVYFKPSSSAKEWIKEALLRHGLGHGAIRRKYGKYKPPLRIPAITLATMFTFLILFMFGLWQLLLLLVSIVFLGIMVETYRLYQITKQLSPSLRYVLAFITARNMEFLGFIIGYAIPPRVLRKITKR